MAEVGAAGDYNRAQVLIADKREVGAIDYGTSGATFSVGAMTRLAVRRVYLRAIIRIARGAGIGRGAGGCIRNARPVFAHASDQKVNLLIRQRAASSLRERRHRSAGNSVGDDVPHRDVVDDR